MDNMGANYEVAMGLFANLKNDLGELAGLEGELNGILIGLNEEVFGGQGADALRGKLAHLLKCISSSRAAWEQLVSLGEETVADFESQDQQIRAANPIKV